MNLQASPPPPSSFRKKLLVTACVLFGIGGIAMATAAFWYQHNFNASPFKGVQLSPAEQQVLNQKITVINGTPSAVVPDSDPAKTLVFSEREINGYLQQQGLGDQIKISIGGGSMSASALIPFEKDAPLVGGRTVRVKIALSPKLERNHRMGLYLSELSIGGISPPNAWLGGIKGKNLFAEDENDPLLKGLSEGIKSIVVQDGEIRIVLND